MIEDLIVHSRLIIPGRELQFTASRASGAGGQGVNKTSSRVTLRLELRNTAAVGPTLRARLEKNLSSRITTGGVLQVHVETERSQYRNREIARERLARLVREAVRPPKPRKPTKPSRGARQRRMDDKKHQSRKKAARQKDF